MRARYLPFLALFVLSVPLPGQGLQVLSVFPRNQEIQAAPTTPIVVEFDAAVDPASVQGFAVKVFGRWSGPMPGELKLSAGNTRLEFTPDEPFFAGEWVSVTLSKAVKSSAGQALEKGYFWNFWIATQPGTLNQSFKEEIPLRQAGEGLLQTYGAYAGDLNDDGYSDLTVVNETADDLRILLNDGQGNYPTMTVLPMGGNGTPSPNEGADFNNDGAIDLAVTTAWNDEVRILFGDGNGSFSDPLVLETQNGVRGIVVADFNLDGWDDFFTTNRLSGNMTIFLNDGSGGFTQTLYNTAALGETACALTDANNDGIADIFVGAFESREILLLLGDGNANFTLSTSVDVAGQPWMLATGDLNGDGNADVVSANSSGDVTSVLLGTGTGGMTLWSQLQFDDATFPLAIDLGDLDGDGDLDMVTSNYSSKNYSVLENDGQGNFSLAVLLQTPFLGPDNLASCAILHDRNNDGDLDISLTDEGEDLLILFTNGEDPVSTASQTLPGGSLTLSPNPSSHPTTIRFSLPQALPAGLRILDLQGREVFALPARPYSPGWHSLTWNGRTQTGTPTPPGVYWVLIETPKGVLRGKLVLP